MVAGNHARRTFSYLLWPAQNEDDPQKYENDSVAWLTVCPLDTLYVLLSDPSQTYRLSFVFSPAERVSRARPASCQAESTHHLLHLVINGPWQSAPGQTTNVLTIPLFNRVSMQYDNDLSFSSPLKFSRQIDSHTWTQIHGQNLPLISGRSTQKQLF